ncbi:hypothetical protein PsYK624_046910 [Phanerochaete sordida]|uniref:Uncharacterized protein n=1 Tax=Phanerochaete sordida TaxID=48140 RepID=A0A9P3G3T4_9APHY|nr:hypothetical protein PsYK624_046910 [Phanerochaete sordida]
MRADSRMTIPKAGILTFAAFLGLGQLGAHAQITTAVCGTDYIWMDNDKGQQPCLVAAYLEAPCLSTPSDAVVLGLVQGLVTTYTPPGPNGFYPASICMCSSVLYSLLSACAICQGFGIDSFSDWTAQCPSSMISNGAYPDPIPAAVGVPQWAYLNISTTGGFDVTGAQAVAAKSLPDVSSSNTAVSRITTPIGEGGPTNAPTNTAPTFSVPSISVPSISVPTFSVPTSNGGDTFHVNTKRKTNVGAIVGGVVGGISALISTITGIWLWIKRRARRAAAAAAAAGVGTSPQLTPTPDPEKLQAHSPAVATPPPAEYFPTTLEATPAAPLRLYDPDDPTTYPNAQPFVDAGVPGLTPSHPGTTPSPPAATPANPSPNPHPSNYEPTQY